MISPSNRLSVLLDEAFKVLFVDNLGVNHAESIFTMALQVLRNDSDARAWFLERVTKEIIHGCEVIPAGTGSRPKNFIDGDLICFVAHATRWQEFADATKIRKQSASYIEKLPGSRDMADVVDAALSDDWEDKDFYKTFEA